MNLRGPCLAAAVAALAAGCAQFAPPPAAAPELPTLDLTASERFGAAAADAPSPGADDLRWWRLFGDPELVHWVESALAGNVDIAIAAERVEQARALLRGAGARRGPTLGAGADVTLLLRRDDGERLLRPGASLALDFDTDLWGGLREAERAAAAGLERSLALRQAARLQAASLTARVFIEWRAAQQDEQALADALALQREALRIVGIRVEAGLAPVLDRDRAIAELAATEAEQAAAAARSAQARSALQVLAGERPRVQVLHVAGAPATAVPALQGPQPVSRPLDLLRNRPDLRAAEQALLAAAAEIGVAEAALRPRLRLPGSLVFGAVAAGGSVLELAGATLAAALDMTLFDGGARQAEVDAAVSRAREAALVYRQTLLNALLQVEDALVAQQAAQRRIAALERASAAATAAEAQAQTLYRAGLSGFLELFVAQRIALDDRRALLQARADAARAAVVTFEALGLIEPETAPAS